MKKLITLLAFALPVLLASAQTAPYISATANLQRQPYGYVTSLPGPPPGVEGSFYLYDAWSPAEIIMLDDKLISDVSVKLDLLNQFVEIDHEGKLKVLPFNRIKYLTLKRVAAPTEYFVSGKALKFVGTPYDGLFKISGNGNFKLLILTRTKQLKPNYNAALDTGSKDYTIVHEETFFIFKDNVAVLVSKNKRKLIEDMNAGFSGEFSGPVNKSKLNKEANLLELIALLNDPQ